MDNLRLFVALDFTEGVKADIKVLQNELQKSGANVKWVEPKNLHLTLKFIGDAPASRLPSIKEALEKAAERANPLEIVLKGLGVFPGKGEPRVLWIGIGGQNNLLGSLARRIETNLSALGIPRENRAFNPHLTLGRVRSQAWAQQLKEKINEHQSFGPLGPIEISKFQLLKSELTKRGPIYTVLQEFNIQGNI